MEEPTTADSSGSIDYLVINYAGAQINAESQYNGLDPVLSGLWHHY